jgi:pimeloyl-ACP methyl ester carboxylesterase
VQGHNTWDALTAITAPTLVLHGERDGIVRVENGRNIAARIPGARLRTWTEGRHLFFVEFADEMNEEVIGFLDEHDAVIALQRPAAFSRRGSDDHRGDQRH